MGALLNHVKKLEADAERAAKAAKRKRGEFKNTAVNWGDFHCVEAAIVLPSTGQSYYLARFEEANTSNRAVHDFIQEYLAKRGWENVEIEMEW